MKLKVKKSEVLTQGTGTAAKAAMRDVKEAEEAKKKEYEKEVEEVVLKPISAAEQKARRDIKVNKQDLASYQETDKMITVTFDGVHLNDEDTVRNAMLNSPDLYGYITKKVNPRNYLFGWVKYKDFILPTYDLEVVYDTKHKKYLAYSQKYADYVPVDELQPVVLNHYSYGESVTVNFDIYKYLKFDGVFFTPGTGLKFATDVTSFGLIDMSQLYLRRAQLAKNIIVHFFVPVEETEENQKAIPLITNLTGYRNDISGGVTDLVKFTYEFSPSEISNFSTQYVKEFIGAREFAIPHELVTQAKTICNAIEANNVTAKQLEKLADILKIRFDVVVSEEIRHSIKFNLPVLTEKNKAIYEMTDMTEEEYNMLVNGIEVSEGVYGFDELVSAFKSGNYDTKDVQFILDKFRESVTLR